MIVTSVFADGFKNLENVNIKPHPEFNIITGMNAQGKTNLIECIWLMTGCRSFRGSREKEYVGIGRNAMKIEISFQDERRIQNIKYNAERERLKEKKIHLNGVDIKGTGKLFENFKCVVFTPDDIDYIKGGPDKRRSFIDMCCCQLKHSALNTVKKYSILLMQRNALLKSSAKSQLSASAADTITVWDRQLASTGTYLSEIRNNYIKLLNDACARLYSRITGGKENLEIKYCSNIFGCDGGSGSISEGDGKDSDSNERIQKYYKKLSETIEDDIRLGYTRCGAHRDDILIKINGMNIKEFGSQGQKKTAALVLKLGQAEIYYKNRNESPVILLDDVMGELDENRQKLVFETIKGMQVFITACNENAVNCLKDGCHFRVENGRVW